MKLYWSNIFNWFVLMSLRTVRLNRPAVRFEALQTISLHWNDHIQHWTILNPTSKFNWINLWIQEFEMHLSPKDIRFCQDTVSEYFRDDGSLLDLYIEIVRGYTDVEDIKPITCVWWKQRYWAVDGNRRLLVYKVWLCNLNLFNITVKCFNWPIHLHVGVELAE